MTHRVESATAVLFVEAIEPVLPFWEERLGFTRVTEMDHGEALGFVILASGNASIMYQTLASMADELPTIEARVGGTESLLYVRVNDLDDVIERLSGVEIEVGPRTTFYGAREIILRDPAGHLIVFAQFAGEPETTA